MTDLETQIRSYSRWLAEVTDARSDADGVTDLQIPARSSWSRRTALLAAVASVAVLVAGLAAIVGRRSSEPAVESERVPRSASSTTTVPDGEIADGQFDLESVFGDVGTDALAVADDGRVVAADGNQLIVRARGGAVDAIGLPDGVDVTQVRIGPDHIAVAWGVNKGVEVDLGAGEVVTGLDRVGDTWSRTDPGRAGSYGVLTGRPLNPLGLGALVRSGTRLPVLEGSGCFETVADDVQSWLIPRPAECSALSAAIAPLADGGFLVLMRTPGATGHATVSYTFVLRLDGSIEELDPINHGVDEVIDVQPGPGGLVVLTASGTVATIEHLPLPGGG